MKKIDLRGWLIIIFSMIGFASLILLPFFVHSTQQLFISASPGLLSNCSAGGETPFPANQCSTWEEPGQASLIASLGIIGFIIFGLLVLMYAKSLNVQIAKKFSLAYLALSSVTAVVTIFTYASLRPISQNHVVAADSADNISLGYGLTTSSLINLTIIYLVVPLLLAYRSMFSQKYVGTIKKKELFQ